MAPLHTRVAGTARSSNSESSNRVGERRAVTEDFFSPRNTVLIHVIVVLSRIRPILTREVR